MGIEASQMRPQWAPPSDRPSTVPGCVIMVRMASWSPSTYDASGANRKAWPSRSSSQSSTTSCGVRPDAAATAATDVDGSGS